MRKARPRRPSAALVVACVALFVALGGAAYAGTKLAKNSVGTKQLKKNAVTSKKIKGGAVTAAKLAKGAVTGPKIGAGAVTGDKVDTATLGKVPAAAQADRADTAASADNGAKSIAFTSAGGDPTPGSGSPGAHRIFTLGPLSIDVSCLNLTGSEGRVYVTMASSVNGPITWATIQWKNPGTVPYYDGTEIGPTANQNFAVSDLEGNNKAETGQWFFRNGGEVITVSMHINLAGLGSETCSIEGTAVRATS